MRVSKFARGGPYGVRIGLLLAVSWPEPTRPDWGPEKLEA